MDPEKNVEEPTNRVKVKEVDCKRTREASKAEYSMSEVHYGILCTHGQKELENLDKGILFSKVPGSRVRGSSLTRWC